MPLEARPRSSAPPWFVELPSIRARLSFVALLAIAPACAVATPDDGAPPQKSDARHDGAEVSVAETSVDPDTGTIPPDSTIDDSGSPIDEGVVDTAPEAGPLTCALDEYDVDGDESNGCEVKETKGNHDRTTAYDFGSVSECDGTSTGGYGWYSMEDDFASDERTHGTSAEPGILGRPDYVKATHTTSTFCKNDPYWQLTTTGGKGTYRVTLYRHGDPAQIDSKCSPHEVGGAETTIEFACTGQDDGEVVLFKIEKVSGPREKVHYVLKYHN